MAKVSGKDASFFIAQAGKAAKAFQNVYSSSSDMVKSVGKAIVSQGKEGKGLAKIGKAYNLFRANLKQSSIAQIFQTKAAKKYGEEINKVRKFVSDNNKELTEMSKKIGTLTKLMAINTYNQVTSNKVFQDQKENVESFGKEMRELNKTLGLSPEKYADLRKSAIETSKDLLQFGNVVPAQVVDAMNALTAAGVRNTESLKKYSKWVVTANKSLGISTDDAAKLVYEGSEKWGLGEEAMNRYIHVLSKARSTFGADAGKMAEGMNAVSSDFMLATANMEKAAKEKLLIGMTNVMGNLVTNFADQADDIGRLMLKSLSAPQEAIGQFAQMGIDFGSVMAKMKAGKPEEVLLEIAKKANELFSQGEKYPGQLKQFADAVGMSTDTLLQMGKNYPQMVETVGKGSDTLVKAAEEGTDAYKAWEQADKSLANIVQRTMSYVTTYIGGAVETVGELGGAAFTAAGQIAPMMIMLKELGVPLEKVGNVLKNITKFLPKIVGLAIKGSMTALIAGGKVLIAGAAKIGMAMLAALGPVGWAIAAIVAAIAAIFLIWKYWPEIKEFVSKVANYIWDGIKSSLNKVGEWLADTLSAMAMKAYEMLPMPIRAIIDWISGKGAKTTAVKQAEPIVGEAGTGAGGDEAGQKKLAAIHRALMDKKETAVNVETNQDKVVGAIREQTMLLKKQIEDEQVENMFGTGSDLASISRLM